MENHIYFMNEAIEEAKKGLKEGGIPIGSVLVHENKIIGRGHNRTIQDKSSILHAEIDCIKNAGFLSPRVYSKCTLYSTLSPCDLCTGISLLYKIPNIVIGEKSTFQGPEDYAKSRNINFVNLDLDECKNHMKNFIKENPKLWNQVIGEEYN